MAENGEAPKTFESSLNIALALITVFGGVYLASHNALTSSRPAAAPTQGTLALGDQRHEARLWEDPFEAWERLTPEGKNVLGGRGLFPLTESVAGCTNRTLVLGVMVSGQPYSEDKETRIRSRMAIVSSLLASSYAPEQSEHIGLAASPWPSESEIESWKNDPAAVLGLTTFLRLGRPNDGRCPATQPVYRLRVPFEWYRARTFQDPRHHTRYERVLLLWLDEEYFDSDPLLRLALFRNEVGPANGPSLPVSWALVGPWSSTTLRAMIPGSSTAEQTAPKLFSQVKERLGTIQLILATPTATDEALVGEKVLQSAQNRQLMPRELVCEQLQKAGFKSVTNLACLDSQLAGEVFQELKLRGIDPAQNPNDHIVLISEADTFFARVSSLAFASTLFQLGHPALPLMTPQTWMLHSGTRPSLWPPNLHSFVYLRGLDGQTAAKQEKKDGSNPPERRFPITFEEIRSWTPDANLADGVAQFDYLGRLGDSLAALDRELWRTNRARIRAIGVVGSDVYDALLSMQALRKRLPDAAFFTTSLDARLWHPKERDWSQNLIAVSGYGLQLRDRWQRGMAPFRDSGQTAIFAAALTALGNGPPLGPDGINPRRFEISRTGPVDLSVAPAGDIHPPRSWEPPQKLGVVPSWELLLACSAAALAVLGVWLWRRLAERTWKFAEWASEPLFYRDEDIGDTAAAVILKARANDLPAPNTLANALCAIGVPSSITSRCNAFLRGHLTLPVAVTGCSKMATPYDRRRGIDSTLDELSLGSSCPSLQAARGARQAGQELAANRRYGRLLFIVTAAAVVALAFGSIELAWWQTVRAPGGEPFNLAGASTWPASFIRLGVVLFSVICCFVVQCKLSQAACVLTRKYRLPWVSDDARRLPLAQLLKKTYRAQRRQVHRLIYWSFPEEVTDTNEVDVAHLWMDCQRARSSMRRFARVFVQILLYLVFALGLVQISGLPHLLSRGAFARGVELGTLVFSILTFLFLTFWTIDASRVCSWFIDRLSHGRSKYPKATLEHFRQHWALADCTLLDEWIDMQLVADLTEEVGRLVYWPFIALLLMIVARNSWFERWSWPWFLIVIFGCNMLLAAASSLILQRAAFVARERSIAGLKEKLSKARQAAKSPEVHQADQAQFLLEDIQNLSRGAFAPLTQNPLIGAVLLNSGGVVLLQIGSTLFGQ